jgi:hypothetical protein
LEILILTEPIIIYEKEKFYIQVTAINLSQACWKQAINKIIRKRKKNRKKGKET